MSYEVYVHKFENGDSANIPYDELTIILGKYGEVIEHRTKLYFVSAVGEMFEEAPLLGDTKDNIAGICFQRPQNHDTFPELIYDLLSLHNTCFFATDLEFIQSRNSMNGQLPEEIASIFPEGPKIIKKLRDEWPF